MWLHPPLGEAVGIPLMLAGYFTAGLLFLRGARRYDGRERLAWTLIGSACALAAVGILAVGLAVTVGYDVPAFGPLDIFFIVAYLLNLAGMWVLPHLGGGPIHRLRVFIDGLVGAVAVGLVSWVWFLDRILAEMRSAPPWEVVIGSLYPLIDVATLIVVVVVTLRRSTLRFDPRVLLIGLGFVAQAVADLLYLQRGAGATFTEAEPFYPLFLVAVSLFVIAALMLQNRPPVREYAERRTPWWAMVAPYGAALAMIGLMVARVLRDTEMDVQTIELLVGSILVVVLIIVRQTLAIRETRELVEAQRSALVSSISHELRTPLTAMVGFLEILSDHDHRPTPEVRNELIGIVNHQANYMARIVSDLVMLNRANPELGLQERNQDVLTVVTSAIASLDAESGTGVQTEIAPGLVGRFDRDRIHQVLVNLLTNAARYGGPTRLVVAREEAGTLVIEVHDDGEGVPRRYELMIWDRFERGAHRYNATVPGSGIGLALVAMLVKAHGGSVQYRRSERLGGACFAVYLPDRASQSVTSMLEPVGPRDP